MAASPIAWGDPHEYLNAALVGEVGVLCPHEAIRADVGGVCFSPGHLIPDEGGNVTLDVRDHSFARVGARLCVDVNSDGLCGYRPDVVVPFCQAITVSMDDPPFSLGKPWMVLLDGAGHGQPYGSPCGVFSAGVRGGVYHT